MPSDPSRVVSVRVTTVTRIESAAQSAAVVEAA
jgi:hypothetical protein